VYYRAGPPLDEAAPLDLAAKWPTYGYRRRTVMMKRLGWGPKRITDRSPIFGFRYSWTVPRLHDGRSASSNGRCPHRYVS
jgi:hypothetical protein